MKRALLVAALMVQAVVSTGDAIAQTEEPRYLRMPHRFQIFLEGGGAIPYKPGVWNDNWEASFELGIGVGVSVLPWLEVGGGFQTMSFALNPIRAIAARIPDDRIDEYTVVTRVFYGSTRFIAIPSSRTNPYVEAALGYFKTKANNEGFGEASGLSVAPSAGVQYALNEHWTAYTRFTYIVNFDVFATTPEVTAGNVEDQIIETISVGILLRF